MRHRLVRLSFAFMLAVPAVTVPVSASTSCPALRLDGVEPAQGLAGDGVRLRGDGFCGAPENFFAWGFDGAQGFALEIDRAGAHRLRGTLGQVPATIPGPIHLWSGTPEDLKSDRVEVAGARYRLSGSVLRVDESASGGRFTAKESPGAASSSLDSGTLRLPVPAPPTKRSEEKTQRSEEKTQRSDEKTSDEKTIEPKEGGEISIVIVVETCGPPDGEEEEEEEDSATATKRFVAHLDVACLGRDRICRRNWARAEVFASAIERSVGSLGLEARAADRDIVISHRRCPITSGFAAISQ